MPISTSIEFPQADVSALFAQIQRAQREIGKTFGAAIMMAMRSVSRSLGTATKVSDEYRPYFPVGRTRNGDKIIFNIQTYRGKHSYKGKFKQKFTRNGALRTSVAYAKDEAQLKTFPSVKIKFRGLAKRSWTAYRGAGAAQNIKGITGDAIKAASRHIDFESQMKGDDPYAKLSNKLDYITNALSGGAKTVEGAMARAARAMEHTIDNTIRRRLAS